MLTHTANLSVRTDEWMKNSIKRYTKNIFHSSNNVRCKQDDNNNLTRVNGRQIL